MLATDPDGKDRYSGDAESVSEFYNHINELGARGYEEEDVIKAVGALLRERDHSGSTKKKKWRFFERLAFGLYLLRAEGATVTHDEKIRGRRSGRLRQVDITVRFKVGYSDYLTMIECKDETVKIEQIEGLVLKREDVGADKLIVVSSTGFQKGAIEVARGHGVELHLLTEVHKDWTRSVREQAFSIPFPHQIEFDTPRSAPRLTERRLGPVKYADIQLFDAESLRTFSLTEVVRDICTWAANNKLEMPCDVALKFDRSTSLKRPDMGLEIPLYGMSLKLQNLSGRFRRIIDLPRHLVRYRTAGNDGSEIDETEIELINSAIKSHTDQAKSPGDSQSPRQLQE
jgi:hypothetical protein